MEGKHVVVLVALISSNNGSFIQKSAQLHFGLLQNETICI
jgi:hypothetical protein